MTEQDPFAELGGAYFHQDWPDFDADERHVVERFARDNPHLIAPTLARLAELQDQGEAELETYFASIGLSFDPSWNDGTHVDFLRDVERWLRGQAP